VPRARTHAIALAALGGLALALAGCAIRSAPSGVQLLVTREFGAHVVQRTSGLNAREGETMLALLSNAGAFPSSTRSGFVASIDGFSAAGQAAESGQSAQWVYYVNGVQARKPASTTKLLPGDHVWWDLHDASQSAGVPAAIVGAYPEPFLNGIEGKRLPVRIECTNVSERACSAVTASLRSFSVPAAIAGVGSGGAPETLRVIVGEWARIEADEEAQRIAQGPGVSGVYAFFSTNGKQLTLLDAQGQGVRTLGADTGLVAATQSSKEAPVWVVTGTDAAGVQLAARAFNQGTLEDHFAVVVHGGVTTSIPVPSPRSHGV